MKVIRSIIANFSSRQPRLTQAGIERYQRIQSLHGRTSNVTQVQTQRSFEPSLDSIVSSIRRRISTNLVSLPNRKLSPTPYDEYKISLTTLDGEKLHGFLLPAPQGGNKDKVVIFLQGGEENSTVWVHAAANLQEEVRASYLVVGYRGFGRNTGTTTIEGFQIDTRSMYSKLLELGFEPDNISVYGRSLGGALGLELAASIKVRSVVAQSSFSSFEDFLRERYLWIPFSLVDTSYLNSSGLIAQINDGTPVLIGHGSRDRLVGVHQAKKLHQYANEPKKLIILPGAGHVHLRKYFTKEYYETLREMIL